MVAFSLFLPVSLSIGQIVTSPVLETPTKDEIIRAFTGRLKIWRRGEITVVYILPRDHYATKVFVGEVLHISPSAFEDLYIEARDNQQRNPYRPLENEAQMINYVSATVGSIGYITNSLLINEGKGHVKAIYLQR